jgi:hypothetical protein
MRTRTSIFATHATDATNATNAIDATNATHLNTGEGRRDSFLHDQVIR